MSNCSRRVAPLHTHRHCYATQNAIGVGSSTFHINVILQFACMCVCLWFVHRMCLAYPRWDEDYEPTLRDGSAIYSLPLVLEWMQPNTSAKIENPQSEIGFAPRGVQSTPTVHKLRALSAAMEAEDGMCVDVDHRKLLRSIRAFAEE